MYESHITRLILSVTGVTHERRVSCQHTSCTTSNGTFTRTVLRSMIIHVINITSDSVQLAFSRSTNKRSGDGLPYRAKVTLTPFTYFNEFALHQDSTVGFFFAFFFFFFFHLHTLEKKEMRNSVK